MGAGSAVTPWQGSPLIHLHTIVFTGWLVLFMAQAVFAATGRLRWHLRLGWFGDWRQSRSAHPVYLLGLAAFTFRVWSEPLALTSSWISFAAFVLRSTS